MLRIKLQGVLASCLLFLGFQTPAQTECGDDIAHAAMPMLIATDASPSAFFTVLASANGSFYQLRDGISGLAKSYLPSVQLRALPYPWQSEWGQPRELAVQSLGNKVYEGVGLIAVSTSNERLAIGSSLNGQWHWLQESGETVRGLSFLALNSHHSRLFVLWGSKVTSYDIRWKGRDEIWVGPEEIVAENFGSYDFLSVIDSSTCFLASELGHFAELNHGVLTRSEKIGAWVSAFVARPSSSGPIFTWVGGNGTLMTKTNSTEAEPLLTLPPNVVARDLAFAVLPSHNSFGTDWMEGLISRFISGGDSGSRVERVLVLGSDGFIFSPWSHNQSKAVRISTAETAEANEIGTVEEDPLWPYARALGISLEDWAVAKRACDSMPSLFAKQASLRMWLDHHSYELAKQHNPLLVGELAAYGSKEEQWMLLDHLKPGTRNALLQRRPLTTSENQEIEAVRSGLGLTGVDIGVAQTRLLEITAFNYGLRPDEFVFSFRLWLGHQDLQSLRKETLGSQIARFLAMRVRGEAVFSSR